MNQLPVSPLPRARVFGMRPPCCPGVSLAAPAHRTAFASDSPAPAPCVSNKIRTIKQINPVIDKLMLWSLIPSLSLSYSLPFCSKRTTVEIFSEVPVPVFDTITQVFGPTTKVILVTFYLLKQLPSHFNVYFVIAAFCVLCGYVLLFLTGRPSCLNLSGFLSG